jgi:hypothetical protein
VTNGAISAALLRRELSARGEAYARKRELSYELSYGEVPVVVFEPCADGHGNFLPETFQAIQNNPLWTRRLKKVHTQAKTRLPKLWDHRWCELDTCNSSDALLMNVFCHPKTFVDGMVAAMLGIGAEARPEFGVRARIPMKNGRTDRTEVDMVVGDLLVEAKLTETDFQTASKELIEQYQHFTTVFARKELPRRNGRYVGYQLIRNVLAAHASGASFCLLADARRPDLREQWFTVMRSVRDAELRTRCKMLTWQELAEVLPERLRCFLAEKYGIGAEATSLAVEAGD